MNMVLWWHTNYLLADRQVGADEETYGKADDSDCFKYPRADKGDGM
jgi:hypothetical protein